MCKSDSPRVQRGRIDENRYLIPARKAVCSIMGLITVAHTASSVRSSAYNMGRKGVF